ncbi:hypothetical protein AMS68_000899 [Peltaster fructicola]|uniref:N-acetyltransferase domain-containing protein n=1 Tax=Peltaster fructicola TaxID=286661 RepID=A0A6H0XKW2_9PEZI|nr:hypothetical protein AMS68_000899 [Peltaster fructicola]
MAVIRERTEADLDGCATVLKAVHKASGYPVRGVADPVGFISNPNIIQAWVAEHAGRIVGHVGVANPDPNASDVKLWKDGGNQDDIAALERLFVDPEAQGLGIAKQLISTAVAYAASRSLRLVLYNLEKDTIARRMYEKLGWTFYGNFQFRWAEDSQMKAYCFVSPALS